MSTIEILSKALAEMTVANIETERQSEAERKNALYWCKKEAETEVKCKELEQLLAETQSQLEEKNAKIKLLEAYIDKHRKGGQRHV